MPQRALCVPTTGEPQNPITTVYPKPCHKTGMLNKAPPGNDGRQQTDLAAPRGNFLVPLMVLSDCHWVLLSQSLLSAGANAAWYPGAVGRMAANPATGRAWGLSWKSHRARNIPIPPILPTAKALRYTVKHLIVKRERFGKQSFLSFSLEKTTACPA